MRIAPKILFVLACLLSSAAHAQNPLLELVTDQAQGPSYLADPGDGRLFITELDGYIRIHSGGSLQSRPNAFLNIASLVDPSDGEGGLHSMAFDPNYSTNRFFYVAYTRTGAGAVDLNTVIARYTTMSGDPNHADPNSAKVLIDYPAPPGGDFHNHKGGQLQFGPDDMLYFGFGDGGSQDDPGCRSQRRDVLFGKILRIDPDGSNSANGQYGIPASNPFDNDPNYAPEIFALGFRNPYRFSFDRSNGDLWVGDVGGSIREEIDIVQSGENYGWKVREGTVCRHNVPTAVMCPAYVPLCTDSVYEPPFYEYVHGGGDTIIGGYVYRGATAAWRGRYIFGDYGRSDIYALIDNGTTWDRVTLSDNEVNGPVSFGQDHDGELYVLAVNIPRVYRLRFDLLGGPAPHTEDQAACVRKLNEGFGKIANETAAQIRSCVDKAAGAKLVGQTADQCVTSDPKQKLAKLRDKTDELDTDLCTLEPEVGYAGSDAGNDAAELAELDLAHDVLGATLQTAIRPKASDKNGAGCQKAVLSALASCQKARRGEFLTCKKLGLKEETLLEDDDLAECLDADPKAKIAKACDPATGKIRLKAIANSCTKKLVDLSTAFPGCNTDDPAALAACLDLAGRCRMCELYDAADSLDTACGVCDPP